MIITLINQYTGPLFIDVVNVFAKDHQVCLVTGSIHEGGKKIYPSVKIKKLATYRRNSSWIRLLTWSTFTLQCLVYLLRTKTGHLLLVTNPPFTPILGSLLYKIRKQPFSLLIYDLYPDVMGQLGFLSRRGWIYKLWGKMNRSAFNNAMHIFTISQIMAEGIKKYMDHSEKELSVIPPWADNEFLKPVCKQQNPFCIEHKLIGKLVILYSGNMGITHDLESVLISAVNLKDNGKVSFIMIGDGAKKQALMKFTETSKLKNVLFLPFQPVDTLPYSLASGDIAVITLGKGAELWSVPSKTYSMMATGCALLIIAHKNSEIAQLALKYECGCVFDPGDTEGITSFITLMYNNHGLLEKYKENARKASYNFTSSNAFTFVERICGSPGG